MKNIVLILFLFLSIHANAQEKSSTTDLKLGVGLAQLGTGDYGMLRFGAEFTKKINRWFSGSVAVYMGAGYDNAIFLRQTNAVGADLNVFISPFGNQRKNNFKIGTGFTGILANITASYGRRGVYNRELDVIEYREDIRTETRRQTGFSMIVENELNLGKNHLLGFKVLIQPYNTGDIVAGLDLKFGIKF